MNLTIAQIRSLLAPIYKEACLNNNVDMSDLARLLEYFAGQFQGKHPHSLWERLDLDEELYDTPAYRGYLVELKRQYFVNLARATADKIAEVWAEDPEQGFDLWLQEYIVALVDWDSIVYTRLCAKPFDFTDQQKEHVEKLKKINEYIFDGRWADVYPYYCERAEDTQLSDEQRSKFSVYAGQVQLYHVIPDYKKALEHFERAIEINSGAFPKRGMGEYYLGMQNYEQAREYFMSALTTDPADINTYLYLGDSYRDQREFEIAEQWYNDALRLNFMESSVYRRLILLNGYPEYIKAKNEVSSLSVNPSEEISDLVNYTKTIEINHPDENFINGLYRDAGYAFSIAQDYAESIRYYRKAITSNPEMVQAYIDIGYILSYDGKYEESLEMFTKASEIGEPLFDVYWGLAYIYAKMEKYQEAVEAHLRCLQLLPSRSETVKYNLAFYYEKLGQDQQAKGIYKQLVEDHPDEQKYVTSQKELLKKNNEIEELEQLLKHQISVDPKNPLRHNDIGNFYFEQQRYQQAIRNYQHAIDLDESEPVYWENMGLASEKSNQPQRAEEAYLKAIELDEGSGEYLNRLGVFYNNQGDHEKAIPCYTEAIRREPENILYLNNLGIAYTWKGQMQEAEKQFKTVLRIDPNNPLAHSELGSVYIKLYRYQEAREHLQKSVELEPENVSHLGNLAFLYQQSGDYESALDLYHRALEIDPDNDFYHNQAGVMYHWQGRLREAETQYRLAIEKKPDVPLYYANLGLALESLADTKGAEEAYALRDQLTKKGF